MISIGTFLWWEYSGREKLYYQDIVVLNVGLKMGEEVKAEDLIHMKVAIEWLNPIVIKRPEDIIGQISRVHLKKGIPLTKDYFKEKEKKLNDNECFFKMPSEWLLSYPPTLRKSEFIKIVPVGTFETLEMGTEKKHFSAEVAYVKDSSNKEVLSLDNENDDGGAVIDEVIITMDFDLLDQLKKLGEKGYKFIIVRSDS